MNFTTASAGAAVRLTHKNELVDGVLALETATLIGAAGLSQANTGTTFPSWGGIAAIQAAVNRLEQACNNNCNCATVPNCTYSCQSDGCQTCQGCQALSCQIAGCQSAGCQSCQGQCAECVTVCACDCIC